MILLIKFNFWLTDFTWGHFECFQFDFTLIVFQLDVDHFGFGRGRDSRPFRGRRKKKGRRGRRTNRELIEKKNLTINFIFKIDNNIAAIRDKKNQQMIFDLKLFAFWLRNNFAFYLPLCCQLLIMAAIKVSTIFSKQLKSFPSKSGMEFSICRNFRTIFLIQALY